VLPKENRLKRKKDFEEVIKHGKGYKEGFLFLKIDKNDLNVSRFGFVVSQKISKKAVVRNKLKRQLREIVRSALPKIKKGIDVVIITISGVENLDFKTLKKNVDRIFAKARINTYPVREQERN